MANKSKQSNNTGTIKLVESNHGNTQFGEAPPPRIVARGMAYDGQNFTPKMTQSAAKSDTSQTAQNSNSQSVTQSILNIFKKNKG